MSWPFDIRTAIAFSAVVTLLVDLLLLVVWRSLPLGLRPSLRWWLMGAILQPLGFLMLSLRNAAPDWLSVVVANALLAFALSCTAIALRMFYGLPERRGRLFAISGMILAIAVVLTYLLPNLHWRLVLLPALQAVLLGSSARAIFRRAGPRGVIPVATGLIFLAGTALLAIRSLNQLLSDSAATDVFSASPVQLTCFALLGLVPILSTVGFLLMCTERSQQELERVARLDYLTGICNRRAIEDLGQRAIAAARRHGTPLSMLVIDIDHFKRINDDYGHHCGDHALVEAVARIRGGLRAEDLVGRLGGEEFVAVLPNTDAASALAVAERIRSAFFERSMLIEQQRMQVTVSVGAALLMPEDRQFTQLLRRADRAMYSAKAAGRNRVMFDATADRSL